jgi:hypothetical protein
LKFSFSEVRTFFDEFRALKVLAAVVHPILVKDRTITKYHVVPGIAQHGLIKC